MPRQGCFGSRVATGNKQQAADTLHFANFAAFSAICGILLFNP